MQTKEYRYQYYLKNKERFKIYNQRQKDKNPELLKDYHKKYYLNNKDKYHSNTKGYYKSNKDKFKKYAKEYREKYPEKVKASVRASASKFYYSSIVSIREAKKAFYIAQKGGKCQKCGQVYPLCVYEFHHIDPNTKEHNINFINMSDEQLQYEINKCILLCSNCHNIEHYLKNKYKYIINLNNKSIDS